MESGVGARLRDARKRRDLDLSEVEAAIKIRNRYLRAIEDEDWDVLPGDVYARGFIRSYAAFLGLDGERLAEEYRRRSVGEQEPRSPRRLEPIGSAVPSSGRRRLRGPALTAVVVLAAAALLVAVGLVGDDEEASAPRQAVAERDRGGSGGESPPVAPRGISLGVTATDEVWVCLLDSRQRPLVDGQTLMPGERVGPFRSTRFAAAFGNGGVELTIDGDPAPTPASSGPVGFEIDAEGRLQPLAEGERPECG